MSGTKRWGKISTGAKPWLESVSHLSQVAAVVLAAYGYFHTVVPVFQKEKLDEDVARLQLEQEKSEAELKSLRERQKVAAATLAASTEAAKRATDLAGQMRQEAKNQAAIADLLRGKNIAVQQTLNSTKKILVSSEWTAFAQNLALAINFKADNSATFFMLSPWMRDRQDAPPSWPDPYALAIESIPDAAAKVSPENRALIEARAKRYIEAHSAQFKCEAPGKITELPGEGGYSQAIRDAAPVCEKKLSETVQALLQLSWEDISR